MLSDSLQKSRLLPKIVLVGSILAVGAWLSRDYLTPRLVAAPQKVAPPKALAWKPATAAQRTAAAQSIRAQLNAFKSGQWDKAISYQSAGLKQHFASTAAFKQMMQRSYPQFTKFKKVEFGPARGAGPIVQMQIKLTGSDNIIVQAVYTMIKEKDIYRVEGVGGGMPPEMPKGEMI